MRKFKFKIIFISMITGIIYGLQMSNFGKNYFFFTFITMLSLIHPISMWKLFCIQIVYL